MHVVLEPNLVWAPTITNTTTNLASPPSQEQSLWRSTPLIYRKMPNQNPNKCHAPQPLRHHSWWGSQPRPILDYSPCQEPTRHDGRPNTWVVVLRCCTGSQAPWLGVQGQQWATLRMHFQTTGKSSMGYTYAHIDPHKIVPPKVANRIIAWLQKIYVGLTMPGLAPSPKEPRTRSALLPPKAPKNTVAYLTDPAGLKVATISASQAYSWSVPEAAPCSASKVSNRSAPQATSPSATPKAAQPSQIHAPSYGLSFELGVLTSRLYVFCNKISAIIPKSIDQYYVPEFCTKQHLDYNLYCFVCFCFCQIFLSLFLRAIIIAVLVWQFILTTSIINISATVSNVDALKHCTHLLIAAFLVLSSWWNFTLSQLRINLQSLECIHHCLYFRSGIGTLLRWERGLCWLM